MSFLTELRRRSVFKIGVTYVIAGWVLIQVAATLLPTYGAPDWVMPVFTTVVMLGLPLALILAWAFEVTPAGIGLTRDADTARGSPSGLILNYAIMGIMAAVIVWLVAERSLDREGQDPLATAAETASTDAGSTAAEVSTRLPNSIAVLPFENLSPDADNAYFAAGIHDTVLLELSKIRDMNVIARTSVLPYAGSAMPIGDIARQLNVETIMEGSVQYAEGQVRITAQLIDPRTGSHIWSGNFDRPFADVFKIQSDIAENIALAIGAELLPQERQLIAREQTRSEQALSLYLKAKALVPNIAPTMDPEPRLYLQQAIAEDPSFAEPYAVLAFHYALSLGTPESRRDLAGREALAREYANTALRLNPNLGMAYGALAALEGAYFRQEREQAYWEQALLASPNDTDVLDDAIRFFATHERLDRARELTGRIQVINPEAMTTIQIWLAYGSGDFAPYLDYMRNRFEVDTVLPDAASFFQSIQAIFEISAGSPDIAADLLDTIESRGLNPELWFYYYVPYANGRLGRNEQAQRQFDTYLDYFSGSLPIAADAVFASLAIHDETTALDILRSVAADPGPSSGSPTNVAVLIENFFKDPVLEQPEFLAVRRSFGGRVE